MAQTKCAHPGCTCEAVGGSEYCSAACEASQSTGMCDCGHAGCAGANPKEFAAGAGEAPRN